jgi:hypothetical protein
LENPTKRNTGTPLQIVDITDFKSSLNVKSIVQLFIVAFVPCILFASSLIIGPISIFR